MDGVGSHLMGAGLLHGGIGVGNPALILAVVLILFGIWIVQRFFRR
jgi:hypothetical protein